MTVERTFIGGLRPSTDDDRDFPLGAITLPTKLEELPAVFRLKTLRVKDQKDTDMCAAFAATLISELQEGIELSPEWQFAAATDDPDEWGVDLRTMLKSLVKHGSLPANQAPYSITNKDADFLRRIGNWPRELFEKALAQRKKSFWKVTGPYDHFDNLRAAIWRFREEKRAAITGLVWQWLLTEIILEGTGGRGFGHAVAIIGWDNNHIVIQNSAGPGAGVNGEHLIGREEINHFVGKYGAYMLVDLSPEDAQHYLDHGIKLEDGSWMMILKAFISTWLPFLRTWK